MYLVTKEDPKGIWCDEPEGFDSYSEAVEYVRTVRPSLAMGSCLVVYRCEEVDTFDGPGTP